MSVPSTLSAKVRSATYIRLVRAVWSYARGYRSWLFASVGLTFASQMVSLAGPYAIGQIINVLQMEGRAGIDTVLYWLALLGVVFLLSSLLTVPADCIESRFGFKLSAALRSDLYRKLCALPLAWHQDHHSGEVIDRINNAQNALRGFAGDYVQLVRLLTNFLGPIAILLVLYFSMGLTTFFAALVVMVITVKMEVKTRRLRKTSNAINHKIAARRADYLSNIRTIITLRLGDQTARDLDRKVDEAYDANARETDWRELRWFVTDTFINIIVVACIAYMVLRFRDPSYVIKVGDLIIVINYLRQISMSFYSISHYYNSISRQITDFEGVDYIRNATAPVAVNPLTDTQPIWSHLAVRDLAFSYKADSGKAQLDHVSLSVRRGEKIALVGASGAGKSTLLTVLRGLYPDATGQVVLDHGAPLHLTALATLSTLIPQEPEIFENTIRFNITLGIDHPDEAVLEACRIACFDTVLRDLPNGLDSDIREKGVNLSGGQKQRLALARGIFAIQQSSLILFDEPTSSVDSVTERRIYANLLAAFPDICLISSIHRLHMLPLFNTVVVMDQGRIVQHGPTAQVMQADGPLRIMLEAYHQNDDGDDA